MNTESGLLFTLIQAANNIPAEIFWKGIEALILGVGAYVGISRALARFDERLNAHRMELDDLDKRIDRKSVV